MANAKLEIGHSNDMEINLYKHQQEALKKMRNGCILDGGVGSGKSITSLCYYYIKIAGGTLKLNGSGKFTEPKFKVPLYIITTAKKRDSKEWEQEMLPFLLSTDPDRSICHIPCTIDSWNNIKKYVDVENAFFLMDEDRVTGSGAWVKAFLKITKKNRWIILSATSGDTYLDYVPVWIANGFFRNKTDFTRQHVAYNPYITKYPCVDHFVGTKTLDRYKEAVLVHMDFEKPTTPHYQKISTQYDVKKYKKIMKERWDPYEDVPIENVSKLCYLLRKVCNSDQSRINAVKEIVSCHKRCIIFYNFDYELEILHKIGDELKVTYSEWNGHKHEKIPEGEQWLYFCQYTSAAEGWNAITTDTMIFYSLNYSYKTMVQSAGRIDRLNTPYRDLYYYYIRSTAPIDLAIMKALKEKKKFNERRFIGV